MYDTTTKLLQLASKKIFKPSQTNSEKSVRNYPTLLYIVLLRHRCECDFNPDRPFIYNVAEGDFQATRVETSYAPAVMHGLEEFSRKRLNLAVDQCAFFHSTDQQPLVKSSGNTQIHVHEPINNHPPQYALGLTTQKGNSSYKTEVNY